MHVWDNIISTCIGWKIEVNNDAGQLFLYKTTLNKSLGMVISFSISINANFEWNLHYLGHPIKISECSMLANFPRELLTLTLIKTLTSELDGSKICPGNPDQKFQVLSKKRQGIFKDHAG